MLIFKGMKNAQQMLEHALMLKKKTLIYYVSKSHQYI